MTDINNHDKKDISRRDFIRTSALTAGAIGTLAACGHLPVQTKEPSNRLTLKATGYKFNRFKALFDGKVNIKGCTVQFEEMGIGDMNTNVFSGPQTSDFSEIGLHPFMLAYANEGFRAYTLLPIFPIRQFRHKSIFIRTDRGIKKPEDLKGKIIGTPGYSSTSLTWIRGVLKDEYGIKPEDIKWVSTAEDSSANVAGKISKQEQVMPKGISIITGPKGKDDSDLIEAGDVDALFHAAEPRAYLQGHPKVARLFPDSRAVEQAYYSKTGIFPIMHVVAIKKHLLHLNPWLAQAIFDAYSEAKQVAYQTMIKVGWASDMLPWYVQEFEETRKLMGDNFYSYGMKNNRKTLETLCRYSYDQGLTRRKLKVEDLFDPLCLELNES